jgi:hypothetical protein
MTNSTSNREFFEIVAKILLRCWLFGLGLLLVWAAVMLLGRDVFYRLNSDLFGLAEHELDLISYSGIVFTKVLVLVFFFIPWAAIRLVLKTK